MDILATVPLQLRSNGLQEKANELAKRGNILSERSLAQGDQANAQGHAQLQHDRVQTAIEQHVRRHDGRLLDEKVKQMESMANLSALIGGFEMVVLVESQLPDTLAQVNEDLMVLFAITSSVGVGMMLTCMLISSYTLFRLLHFRSHFNTQDPFYCIHGDNVPFDLHEWEKRFRPAWDKAFKAFQLGVPCFMLNLIVLGWIKFYDSPRSCTVLSFVMCISLLYWLRFLVLDSEQAFRTLTHARQNEMTLCKDSDFSMCSTVMRPTCASCRFPMPVHARFCGTCGHPREGVPACASCGHIKITQTKYCEMCREPAGHEPSQRDEEDQMYVGRRASGQDLMSGSDASDLSLSGGSDVESADWGGTFDKQPLPGGVRPVPSLTQLTNAMAGFNELQETSGSDDNRFGAL